MRGLVKLSPGAFDASLELVPELVPSELEVKIQVYRAGICGTDLKVWRGQYNPKGYRTPVVLGHEFSGRIVGVGGKVSSLVVGDLVTAQNTFRTCGHCAYCRTGRSNLCSERLRLGFDVNGAFADYLVAPAEHVFKLPEGVDLRQAALLEPIAVASRAVTVHSTVRAGDQVAVIGPGTIGLLVAMIAQIQGAQVSVMGLEIDHQRLALATKLGFNAVTVEALGDPAVMADLTMDGFNTVFECSGSQSGVALGLGLLRRSGEFVQVGTASHDVEVPFMTVAYHELRVAGSFSHTRADWERSIRLLSSKTINVEPLITHEFTLEQWEEGMHRAGQGQSVKVLLAPIA